MYDITGCPQVKEMHVLVLTNVIFSKDTPFHIGCYINHNVNFGDLCWDILKLATTCNVWQFTPIQVQETVYCPIAVTLYSWILSALFCT